MKRFDIINYLIEKNNYKSFLEIGTQEHINISNVNIGKKISVDPDPQVCADYVMTSDLFFELNKDKFDIVFVDGLHHSDFTYRDIINSLKILNPGGCVVVHDVIPTSYESQLIPLEKTLSTGSGIWEGDVWKAWVKLRTEKSNLNMEVVDTDHGCGIIHPIDSMEDNRLKSFNNGYYVYDRNLILNSINLITIEQFISKYSKPLDKKITYIG
jgi:hypothetical protein